MCSDHKLLQRFPNDNNANNKVNQWSLELATYNITFKWISSAQRKAADHLSWLVEVPRNDAAASSILINSVAVSPADKPTTHTHSKSQESMDAMPPDTPSLSQRDTTKINALPPLMGDHRDTWYKCKKQIHSASASLNKCLMEKHLTMKLTLSTTSIAYSINIPWIMLKTFWHWSSPNHGISQC